MERNREARRASTATTNGLSRRRQRVNSLRESPEEEGGQMELQETVRLRDRVNGKDRDRDRELFITEDSVDDEEEHEAEEDRRLARMTVMASTQNHRRSYATTPKFGRQSPPSLKVTEEMIGVSVPRKARSGSVKRSSHEYGISGGCGGVGEDYNHRQPSNSPASRSGDANSPSSSNLSVRKKMKSIGTRNQPPHIVKSSTSVQDDIEFEIAEVLYGLMKQSRDSKKPESARSSSQALDSKNDTNGSKRRKLEAEDGFTSTHVQSGSNSSVIKVETEQTARTEDCSAKISQSRVALCDDVSELGASQSAPVSLELQTDASAPVKSPSCLKVDAEFADSTMAKANLVGDAAHSKREDKFAIDLMALPPLEKDGSTDMEIHSKFITHEAEMKLETEVKVEKIVKKEVVLEGYGEKKLETNVEKGDLEMHFHGNGSKLQQAKKQQLQQPIVTIPKAQTSALPFPITEPGWPGSLPPPGYVPPIQRMASTDGSSVSSAAMEHPHFVLHQPRPKRCTTHHYVARNIHCHQQLTKMNQIWPTTASSASPYGATPYNLNVKPPAESRILGNPLQVSFLGGNVISKGPGTTTCHGQAGKDNSSKVANFVDTAHRKQLVLQQAPQPVPAANLPRGPAFIFPMSQHQSGVAATSNQSGTSKSATSTKNASLSSSSAAGAPASSSTLPAVAAAMSFNYPNLSGNEAQYMAVLQNNGYSFPISTQVGTQSPLMEGIHGQAVPFFTGSFYSSQMFHPSQIKHQQPHTQPLTQPAHQSASASRGSSSSHKQAQSQQQRGSQLNGNTFFTSTNMQLPQSHNQHGPLSHPSAKLEAETSEDTSLVTDGRALHSQKSLFGQNFAVPVQQLNFALMPSTMLGGGGNHGEKQQQSQNSKGGVEFIPPQAFALSYPSFNRSSTAKDINFSSATQNPAIFQSISDMARHGFIVPSAAKVVPSEDKGGGEKTNGDDDRTAIQRKSPTSFGQSLAFSKPASTDLPSSTVIGNTVFDNSAKTLKFILSPLSGNRPHSVTSNSITSTAAAAFNSPNSQVQQQQLIQLQKQQQMMQQHFQQQHAMATRSKAPTTNCQPSTSIAANFPNNASIFSQTFIQSNTSAQSTQWKNSTRTPFLQGTSPSLSSCTTSTIKNFPQQQGRVLQGHTQISFGETNTKSVTSQAHTKLISNQSSSLIAGDSIRTASPGNKAGSGTPTSHSQQTENSTTGPSQKSSPVCGRNVPSIISTCASQVSELKY